MKRAPWIFIRIIRETGFRETGIGGETFNRKRRDLRFSEVIIQLVQVGLKNEPGWLLVIDKNRYHSG